MIDGYVMVEISFLEELLDSLQSMKNYADDGMINRNDPEFKEFFDNVANAEKLIEDGWSIINNTNEN